MIGSCFQLQVRSKYKQPVSYDSELHDRREKLFQHPTLLATPTQNVTGFHDDEYEESHEKPTEADDQGYIAFVARNVPYVLLKCCSTLVLHTHTHTLTPPTHTDLAPSLTVSPLHSSVGVSSRHELYRPPSSDNPVAQTLYKMLEPEDRVC